MPRIRLQSAAAIRNAMQQERYNHAAQHIILPAPLIPGRVPHLPELRALLESHPLAKQLNGFSIFNPCHDAESVYPMPKDGDERLFNQRMRAQSRRLTLMRSAERRRLILTTWPGITPTKPSRPAPKPRTATPSAAHLSAFDLAQVSSDMARVEARERQAVETRARTAQRKAAAAALRKK